MADGPLPLQFVMSATNVTELPPTEGEIAVVGRSNVGKSSLINALANRNQLARVSKSPGRTQLLNLFEFGDGTTLMDLPGYGFAKVPGRVRESWAAMIEGYLLEHDNLAAVMLLIDAEIGPTALDVTTIEWLADSDLTTHIVATKHDKVKPSVRDKRRRDLAVGCGVTTKDVLWVSAAKNINIVELRRRVRDWVRPAAR